MSFDPTEIGFFQFDNLVRNRVPFLLLHDGVVFSELYGGLERDHLERWSVQVSFRDPVEKVLEIAKAKAPMESIPVVLLSQEGGDMREWVGRLEAGGFFNVHWVRGGWEELKREAADA